MLENDLIRMPNLQAFSEIGHCYTTRKGGVSTDFFESMNPSFIRGDEAAAVKKNFEILAQKLGIGVSDFVLADQTHTTNVAVVTAADKGNGITKPLPYKDVDGLVTNCRGVALMTYYADCVPLYFYDPIHHAIGMSHAGWRGTANNMVASTVKMMKAAFGTQPQDLVCAIGPCICQDCYEVGEDVARAFSPLFQDTTILKLGKQSGKFQLDLKAANQGLMQAQGIQHIDVSSWCTKCHPDRFFSHRQLGTKRGTQAGIIFLK